MKFVFDLDGTICFKGRPLSEEIVDVLQQCLDEGIEVIFASARPIRDMLPVLPKQFHGLRMVGGNGAFVYAHNEIEVAQFDDFVLDQLFALLEEYRLPYLVDGRWDYSFTGLVDHPIFRNLDPLESAQNLPLATLDGIVKFVFFTRSKEIEKMLRNLPITLYVHGDEGIFDISPRGISKWSGLQKLGIDRNEFVAFGNDTNDFPMFEQAREAICVGKNEGAVTLASYITSEEEIVEMILKMKERFI